MSKKWKRIVASAVLASAVTASGLTALVGNGIPHAAFAQTAWSESAVENVRAYGSTFAVPERSVTVDGVTVTAQSVVIRPDGSATTEKRISLSMSGIYTVVYTAVVGRKAYSDEVTFRVDDANYVFTGEDSSATYGKHALSASTSGLLVRLAQGDSITFNAPIDVRGAKGTEALVEAFATPDEKGTFDFEKLCFTFTDFEDSSVYLRVNVRQSPDADNRYGYSCYALAGGNGQKMEGWEDSWGRLHVDNNYGTQVGHSFSASNDSRFPNVTPDGMKISVGFDAEKVQSFVGNTMIIDHDSPVYYDTLWRGFPSGKVKLTISAELYSAQTANFCISAVKGISLTDENYIDSVAPTITVDTGYTELPSAKKGAEYTLPSATAIDDYDGVCEVKTSVWYNYASSNAVMTTARKGKFVPDRSGAYVVIYEATDRSGNVARETRSLRVYDEIAFPEIEIEAGETSVTVGELIKVAPYTAKAYSGNAIVTVTAALGGETVTVAGEYFRPTKAGAYTITYTVTDYIGQNAVKTYELTATTGDKPVFAEDPILPIAFIENGEYVLPELYATDYRGGAPVTKKATVTVKDANGTRTVGEDNKIRVAVENNFDKATVVYSCDGATKSYEIPVVKAWATVGNRQRIQVENYLLGNGFTTEKTDEGTVVSATDRSGGFTFANPIIAERAELTLNGVSGASDFKAIEVTLIDSLDRDLGVGIRIVNRGSASEIDLGGEITALRTAFGAANAFDLGYSQGKILIGTTKLDVKTYDNGEKFNGFPSEKILVRVEFEGAENGAQILLVSVNGHPMNKSSSDRIGPKIVIMSDDYGGTKNLGDTVTLPRALAGDTLDPNITFTLKVTDPDGNVVTDANGILLDNVDPTREYTIRLTSYGKYSVAYSASDTFSKRVEPLTYAINVPDVTAPEITFAAKFKDTVKVGETIVIPKFTVSDDLSAAENIRVSKYAFTPSGVLVTIPEKSNSIKAFQAGKYEIRIVATDEAGNVRMVRRAITVTA